jgi:hypothetical protein
MSDEESTANSQYNRRSSESLILERIEQRPENAVVGDFRCTGNGRKITNPCGSLLRIHWINVFMRHSSHKSKISFECPVCKTITDIKYSKYRVKQPKGYVLQSR